MGTSVGVSVGSDVDVGKGVDVGAGVALEAGAGKTPQACSPINSKRERDRKRFKVFSSLER